MKLAFKKIKLFLSTLLCLVSLSCGSRNGSLESIVEGQQTPESVYQRDSGLADLSISYDSDFDIFMLSLTYFRSNFEDYNYIIDFKNQKMTATKNGNKIVGAQYTCLRTVGANCERFEITGLPYTNEKIIFQKENLQITDLQSNTKTTRSVFKIESLIIKRIFNSTKVFSATGSYVKGIGYFANYPDKLSDSEDILSINAISLPGQLPMQEVFYDTTCNSIAFADKSVMATCTFTEKMNPNHVEKKSWLLKITSL